MTRVPWRWTDDPEAPCTYCVQWRPIDPDDDGQFGEHEPYWPDGSVPPHIRRGPCGGCREALALMHEWNAKDPA